MLANCGFASSDTEDVLLELLVDVHDNVRIDEIVQHVASPALLTPVIPENPEPELSLTPEQQTDFPTPELNTSVPDQTPIFIDITPESHVHALARTPTISPTPLEIETPTLHEIASTSKPPQTTQATPHNIIITDDPEVMKFSEPFRKILSWPKRDLSNQTKKRLIRTERISVLSSSQWQSIKEAQENEKCKKIEEVALKKKMRIEKQELVKKEKQLLRDRKQEEKLKKEQQRLEKEKEKILKQQQKINEIEAKQKAQEQSLSKKKEAADIKKKIAELQERESALETQNC